METNANCNSQLQTQNETFLTQDQLISVLNTIISINPNNSEIKQANEILKKFSKNILSLESYLNLIKQNENFKIRQLSAILLLKKLEKHWPKLSDPIKSSFQSLILDAYLSEKNFLVLKALGEVIYRILKLLLAAQENCDLFLNLIFRDPLSYSAEEVNIFETNLYIISELIENNSVYIFKLNKIAEIKNILTNSLKLGSNRMKENAAKCLGNLLKCAKSAKSGDFGLFSDLIPFFLSELRNFSEDTVKHIFENLCELNKESFACLENYFDDLLNLTLAFLTSEEISNDAKLVVSEFLILLAEFNKAKFRSNDAINLVKVLRIAYRFAAEPENAESSANNDFSNPNLNSEHPLYDIGERLIEAFSLLFESAVIFPACVQIAREMLNENSNYGDNYNPYSVKAAIISLGLLAEGCAEILKKNLDEILSLIVSKFQAEKANETIIKSACIIAIDKLTEFCFPNILDFHTKIIPMLISGIGAAAQHSEEIVNKSLICLRYFCKNEDLDLKSYIGDLLPNLLLLLRSQNLQTQKNALAALGAILENAQDLSPQTIQQILETCKFLIENHISSFNGSNSNSGNEEDFELKASALECVSHVAFSVKLVNFGYLIQFFTEFAFGCVKSEVYELQSAGFVFLGSLARTVGQLFAAELGNFMEVALRALKDESGVVNYKLNDEFCMDSDSEEEVEDDGKIKNIKKNESFIDAKCSAILAISNVSRACPKEFLNYIPAILQLFDHMYNLYDENINIEIILAYESLLISIYEAEKILAKENLNYLSNFSSILHNPNNPNNLLPFGALNLKFWVQDFLPKFEKILSESESKNEIVNLLETIYGIIENIGENLFINENLILQTINNTTEKPNLSSNWTLERVVKMLKILLSGEATCQAVEDESDAEDPDEIDHDEEILANIGNIVAVSAEKLQNEFSAIFEDLYYTNLKGYLNPKKQSEENIAIVLGCIADSLCHTKTAAKSLVPDLLGIINENLNPNNPNSHKKSSSSCKKYKNEEVLRNVAYLIGALFAADNQAMQMYLEPCLALLLNLLPSSADAAKDNIIAAIAKAANSQKIENLEKGFFAKSVLEPILANVPLSADPRLNASVFALLENIVFNSENENLFKDFIQFFENYVDRVFGFVKFMALNEFACGIDRILLGKLKVLLEKLSSHSAVFSEGFKTLMEKGYANEEERAKFHSAFINL